MIRVMSVVQPHANMIVDGEQTMVVKPWDTAYRGAVLIVAALRPYISPVGCCVAVAHLSDSRPMVEEDMIFCRENFNPNKYVWVLKSIRPVDSHPVRGGSQLCCMPMGATLLSKIKRAIQGGNP